MGLTKTGFGVDVVNDKIYVIGGHPFGSTQVTIDDVSVYDPLTDQWRSKQHMPGSLAWFGTAVYQDEIYVIGGAWFVDSENQVWVYSPAANNWTARASMPTPRAEVEANMVNGKIYVIGGRETTSSVTDANEVYDPVTDTWTTKTPVPTPVTGYASAVVDGKIYVIGGWTFAANSTSLSRVNLNQIYDPETDNWSLGTPIPESVGANAGATTGVMAPRRIYVIGDGVNQVYDPANDSWSVGEPIPNSAHRLTNFADAEIAVVNDHLYALGGVYKDANENYYSVSEQYTPIGYGTPDLPTQSPSLEPEQTNPFPTALVIASIATAVALILVGSGLLVYFKKRKHWKSLSKNSFGV
jgi:N-acetylneuraminic acid mutarotase